MVWFITRDACGLFCFFFSVGVIWLTNFVVLRHVVFPWLGWSAPFVAVVLSLQPIVLLAAYCHVKCAITNPATLLKRSVSDDDMQTYIALEQKYGRGAVPVRICRKCRCFKPERAHHCSLCKACIVRMDHHCPWVNNCVGASNQKYFVLFLIYVWVGEAYTITLFVWRFVNCMRDSCMAEDTTSLVLLIVTFILSVFFIAFVTAMLYDQCEAIWENSTYVENLQSYKGEERTFYEGLCEVFGERFSWRWFVPSIPAPLQRVNIVKEALAAAPSPLLPPMDEVDRLYDSSIANVISAHVDDDAAGDPREPAARESPTPARDVDDSALLAREAAATVGAAAR